MCVHKFGLCVHNSACAFLAIGLRCYVHVCVVCVRVYSTYFCVVAILFFGLSMCANVPAGAPVSVVS